MRQKDKKLREMKRILSDEALTTPSSSDGTTTSYHLRTESSKSLETPSLLTPSTITTRKKVSLKLSMKT